MLLSHELKLPYNGVLGTFLVQFHFQINPDITAKLLAVSLTNVMNLPNTVRSIFRNVHARLLF
jgi:hypothetical protein